MANKESTFGNAISLRQYLNDQLGSDNGYSDFMKITNINNINAFPCDVDENEGTAADADNTSKKFGLGDYIHDTQLVWVGDRFYLQGKKVFIEGGIEKFSPIYLFPFDAISVTFENKESDGIVHYDLNIPTGEEETFVNTSLSKTQDSISVGNQYTIPEITNVPESYTNTWNTKSNGSGTTIDNTTNCTKIEGHTLYAQWTSTSQTAEPEENN